VTGTTDRDRPPASLNFFRGGGQPIGIAALLAAHITSTPSAQTTTWAMHTGRVPVTAAAITVLRPPVAEERRRVL